jgi:hypothetical protein
MSQLGRDTAIQEFWAGSSCILIATDLWGTNLGQVPIVINYDLPTQVMQYISRVQQQRRYSETESVAINFVSPADERIVFWYPEVLQRPDEQATFQSNIWTLGGLWRSEMFLKVYTGSSRLQGSLNFALRRNVTVSCDMWSLVS